MNFLLSKHYTKNIFQYYVNIAIFLLALIASFHSDSIAQEIKTGLNMGYMMPFSNNIEGYSNGLYVQGDLSYEISREVDIAILIRFEKLFYKNTKYIEEYNRSNLLLGFDTKFFLTKEEIKPYLGFDLNIGKNFEYTKYNNSPFVIDNTGGPLFGFIPKIGLTYPLTDKLNLDTNAKIIYWLGDNNISFFTIGLGLEYSL